MARRSFAPAVLLATLGAVATATGQGWSFTRIADSNTIMPGSASPFQFFNVPSIQGGTAAFAGFNLSVGRRGAYTGSGGSATVIADTSTPAPGGGTFSGFFLESGFTPSIHSGQAVFNAGSPAGGGVFLKTGSTFTPVVTTAMPIPNGGGANFMAINQPSLENGRVTVVAGVPLITGLSGVYSWEGGALSIVADRSTPIPNGPGTFTTFFDCGLDGSIVFSGQGPGGHQGVYRSDTGGALSRLYDTTMVAPGGNGGTFSALSRVSTSDGRVAFYAQGGGQEGFYTDVSGFLQVVANRNTPFPGFPGQFFGGFGYVVIDGGLLVLDGINGSGGVSGVFSTHTGTLAKVLATGDFLDGRVVADTGIGAQALDGDSIALWVSFTNGDYGVYSATIDLPCYPDCNTDGALTVADFGCFQSRFVQQLPWADCNHDAALTVQDFGCFQTRFVAGCP